MPRWLPSKDEVRPVAPVRPSRDQPEVDVVLVNGFRPVDGVTGGALAGALRAPVLLTLGADVVTDQTLQEIGSRQQTLATITLIGGTTVISDAVEKQARDATIPIQND